MPELKGQVCQRAWPYGAIGISRTPPGQSGKSFVQTHYPLSHQKCPSALRSASTIAGLAAARARGREGGRRSAFDKTTLLRAQSAMKSRDCSVAELCAELGITKPTLYRNITPTGELTEAGNRVLSGNRAKQKNGKKVA